MGYSDPTSLNSMTPDILFEKSPKSPDGWLEEEVDVFMDGIEEEA